MGTSCNALTDHRRQANGAMHERVRTAIDELLCSEITPSFYAVADLAGVSRSTLYRKPELRRMVEEARDQAATLQPSWRTALDQLEAENAALQNQIAHLQTTLTKTLTKARNSQSSTDKPHYEYTICRFEAEDRAA